MALPAFPLGARSLPDCRQRLGRGFQIFDIPLLGDPLGQQAVQRLADEFDELLARIREIRASEKRVYQRIRDIFALASDYREGAQETQVFFATMQNKM